ncbi:hypothetical protein G9A89_001535 [Geosiphon pyriformis]|nr:hypothetical protein G9A89_001535 [Geosiphon pyriformis]
MLAKSIDRKPNTRTEIESSYSSANNSVLSLAGLETHPNTKKKHIDSIYSCAASYKKSKKPKAGGILVDSSISPLALEDIGISGDKPTIFWGSEVESIASSVNGFSDVENMANTITKETNYAKSSKNDNMNNVTPRKTHTQMYMLDNSLKAPTFDTISNNKSVLGLLSPKFPVKLFTFDVELSAVPRKTNSNKLITIKKIFYQIDGFGRVLTPSKFPEIIRTLFTSEFSINKAKKLAILISIRIQLIGLWQKALMKFELSDVARSVASKWSVLMGKDSVYVALVVSDKKSWVVRNYHQALLYTLPIDTMMHDLFGLLELYGEKTCFIGHNLSSYVCDRCLVVCFANKAFKLAAVNSVPVYKDQVMSSQDQVHLANIYKRKQAPVVCLVSFGGFFFCVVLSIPSGIGLLLGAKPLVMVSNPLDNSGLADRMVSLKCSIELLLDQISEILRKLSFVELVSLSSSSCVLPSIVASSLDLALNLDMVVDNVLVSFFLSLLVVENTGPKLSLNNSKVFTTKVSGLELKMMALEVSVSLFNSVWVFTSGLDSGHMSSGVVIIMNISLVRHVCKVSEASKINSFIAKVMNESFFIIVGGDFNENGLCKCASFKKCLDLRLVNSLLILECNIVDVSEYFDTNYRAISVLVGLGGLLDVQLNFFHKQTNKDHWKFDFKGADNNKWENFKNVMLANAGMFSDEFAAAIKFSNLDAIWDDLINLGVTSNCVHFALSGIRKSYSVSKLVKSLAAKKTNIKAAIDKRIESFKTNKGHTIRSVLKHPFHKVVLDHLVVDNELILEPNSVKSKVDIIIKGWTRKHGVVTDVSDVWCHQYQPLNYVFDEAFSGVMHSIEFSKLLDVISDLLNGKAISLLVPRSWKKAWVSIIFKSYKWEGVFTNTCPIALIKIIHKILSKILSDRIFLACSTFNVLCEDNFLVLKSTMTQSSIFAIRSVSAENISKKVWLGSRCVASSFNFLVVFIKIEVFFSLLWHIFYDPLLCKTFFFFATGAFIDNTIWVGSSQTATQHIFNIVSEFFCINNISINNDKTVIISINSRVSNPSLSISDLPIFIAKKNESYQYLGIFLLTEGLLKPSLVKANSDVHFFTNLVLRKTVSDKQFLYLVLAVFYLIISYKMQFSFVPISMYNNNTIYHPSFYGLKFFFQVQSESKVASFISFPNSGGILSCLFSHRSYDFSLVCIYVNASDNFLAGMFHGGVLMSTKRLDPCGSVLEWFKLSVVFFNSRSFSLTHPLVLNGVGSLNILEFRDFVSVCDCLSQVDTDSLLVYTNEFLSGLSTVGYRVDAAAFFEDIDLDLDIGMLGLMLSTLAELQTIVLALESVFSLSSVKLFSDSQSALNAYRSELSLVCPNFCNQYWIKGYSGVLRNKCTNMIADNASLSSWYFLFCLGECFIIANGVVVSGNSRHFVHNIYYSVCHVHWKIGSGFKFLADSLLSEVDWHHSSLVWHPNLHMAISFTSRSLANTHTYFIKKCLYNRLYSSVLCLYCGDVKTSDHVFSCKIDNSAVSGFFHSFLGILQLLSFCVSDFFLSITLYKNFVFNSWFCETVTVFHDPKIVDLKIVNFVHSFSFAFRSNVWSVHARHCAYMEKNELILLDGLVLILVSDLASGLLVEVVKLLGIIDAFGVCFGFHKSCLFFSDINDSVSVHIAV